VQNFDIAQISEMLTRMHEFEHKGDSLRHGMTEALAKSFVTPIDREDIYALANGLDDGVDYLEGTLQCIVMYKAGKARGGAVALTKLIIEATQEIIRALELLKDIRKNQEAILTHTSHLCKLESEGDRVFRHEVAFLFEKETDPVEIIKWKDILENLENTLDHCEKLADMLRGVVMKYA
jgi:uncharacterized protein Yka (UPF0111/DUF47 family)